MRISFYKSAAEANRVDKSSYLTKQFEISGVLKDQSSVISPTILIEATPISVPNSSDKASKSYDAVDDAGEKVVDGDGNRIVVSGLFEMLHKCNYAYIPEFSRYYFVEDVSSVRNRLWSVSLRVDPLMSFKDGIYSQSLFCERTAESSQESADVADNEFPIESVPEVTDEDFDVTYLDEGFDALTAKSHPIILTYLANNFSASVPSKINSPSDFMTSPSGQMVPSSWQYKTLALSVSDFVALFNYIKGDDTKAGYVVNCMIYPFDCADESGSVESIVFADGYTTGASGVPISADSSHLRQVAHHEFAEKYPQFPWLDRNPYVSYEILVPYKGYVEIDPDAVEGQTVFVDYAFNPIDGTGTVFLIASPSGRLVYSGQVQLGSKLTFSTTNAREVEDANQSAILSMVISTVGGAMSTGLGIATGNPLAIAGGVGTIATGATKFALNVMHNHLTATATYGSGELSVYAPQKPILRTTRYNPVLTSQSDWDAFHALRGYMCRKIVSLSSLKGSFSVFSSVHLSGLDEAYSGEISQMTSLLESGVIL